MFCWNSMVVSARETKIICQPSSIPRATATATVNMKEKLTYWFRNCDIQLSIFGCNTSLACKQSEHLKAAPTYTVT
eukprot:m.31641 g.31641  ORF g.31641 m.31641 type:complete len:76 (+) comp12089_c0_seq11:1180-1407(+)